MKSKRGRPKGRRVFKYKVYLTSKQIKWLKSQKIFSSASMLTRHVLNAYMRWLLDDLKRKIQESSAEKKQKWEDEVKLLEECLEH